MKYHLLVGILFSLSLVAQSFAATSQLSIIINSPPSTAINCPISYPSGQTSFVEPVAAGTLISSCAVTPSSWSGALTLSGPDAGVFALSGMNLLVGSAPITAARTYNVTVTATP